MISFYIHLKTVVLGAESQEFTARSVMSLPLSIQSQAVDQ